MGDSTETPLHERSALLGKVIPESKFRLDVGTVALFHLKSG